MTIHTTFRFVKPLRLTRVNKKIVKENLTKVNNINKTKGVKDGKDNSRT